MMAAGLMQVLVTGKPGFVQTRADAAVRRRRQIGMWRWRFRQTHSAYLAGRRRPQGWARRERAKGSHAVHFLRLCFTKPQAAAADPAIRRMRRRSEKAIMVAPAKSGI